MSFINPLSGRKCKIDGPTHKNLMKINYININGNKIDTNGKEINQSTMKDFLDLKLKNDQFINKNMRPSQTTDMSWIWYGTSIDSDTNTNDKIGKWMIYYKETEIDTKWTEVCNLVDQGHLSSVKTSTLLKKGDREEYVIIIYTNDYTNKKEILNIGKCIKENIGYDNEMYYKTNEQTSAAIYKDSGKKAYIYVYSKLLEEIENIKIENIIIVAVGMRHRGNFVFQYNDIIKYEYEPDNAYDSNAIKLLVNGNHVAYVSTKHCMMLKAFVTKHSNVKIQLATHYAASAALRVTAL
jgi:hypothetical protein